ncbi:MAG: ABC transporter ATP-binding protein [Chloroflexota bacterium]|nr:ABC transporter ATP-binding protein [Chloroflexota bacterium]
MSPATDNPLPTAAPPALAVDGLTKAFAGAPVVTHVSFAVHQGELVALLGPSGCGKTTTLRVISGLEHQDAGSVTVGGNVVADDTTFVPAERRKIGMVFQDYALFPHMSVGKNVAYGLRRGRESRQRVDEVLELVGLLELKDRSPSELSGGQQQRVALARALAPGPDLVMLDEPFSNLDQKLRISVRREVRAILAEAGTTAILVTHDQEEALSLADRIAVMNRGRIEQMGSPEELYHRPATRFVAGFIGDAQFLHAEARDRTASTVLGEVPIVNESHGEVDLLVRPEYIRLDRSRPESGAVHGQVLSREYFGHDQLLAVRLDGGSTVTARLGAYSGIRPGDGVWVSLRGAMVAFKYDHSAEDGRNG